jgi:hypothetical protein
MNCKQAYEVVTSTDKDISEIAKALDIPERLAEKLIVKAKLNRESFNAYWSKIMSETVIK